MVDIDEAIPGAGNEEAEAAAALRRRRSAVRRNPHPPVHDIRNLLTFKLARIVAGNDRAGQDWTVHEFGLRLNEFRVLSLTAAMQPLVFADAASFLFKDKGQMSRLVKALVEMDLIQTRPSIDDQRTVELVLTEAGRRKHEAMMEYAYHRNGIILEKMTKAEVHHLIALLDKLMASVEARVDGNF